jgi:general secretion pathway protein D
VLTEATIVEVSLKDQYRAGIDWSKTLAAGAGGWTINTLGGGTNAFAGALTPFIQALTQRAVRLEAALICLII